MTGGYRVSSSTRLRCNGCEHNLKVCNYLQREVRRFLSSPLSYLVTISCEWLGMTKMMSRQVFRWIRVTSRCW